LIDSLLSIARGFMPDVPGQEGSRPRKEQQVRPADQLKAIEMLLERGFGRSPQQIDIAHSVTDRPLAHLSDETLDARWWRMAGSLRKAVVWWLMRMDW